MPFSLCSTLKVWRNHAGHVRSRPPRSRDLQPTPGLQQSLHSAAGGDRRARR